MKKLSLFISALAIFSVVSCVEEAQAPVQPDNSDLELIEMSFAAGIDGKTKVEVGTPIDGGYKTFWSPGDAINVYAYSEGMADNSAHLFTTDIEAASASATFTGMVPVADEYYAFYPVRPHEFDPATKTIMLDGIAYNAIPDDKFAPALVAKAEDGVLSFKHLTGYLKFTIPDEDLPIDRVALYTKGTGLMCADVNFNLETMAIEEILSASQYGHIYPAEGEDVVAPGTYYFTLLPGVLEEGFRLEFYSTSGVRYIKNTDMSVEIKAGEIINLGVIDDVKFDYPVSTIPEVRAGSDNEYYRVSGYVNTVVNTRYGNWWIQDETHDVLYIYGTINEFGVYSMHDLIPGDFVTVQGPRYTYGTTIELQDVSVIDIERTLVRPVATSYEGRKVAAEGEIITIDLDVKGENLVWGAHEDLYTVVGAEPVGDYIRVTLSVPANPMGYEYTTNITFTVTGPNDKEYYTYVEFTQADANATVDVTASEVPNVPDGTICRLSGYMTDLVNQAHGEFYMRDYTGDAYIYKAFDYDGNAFGDIPDQINEGDIITVVGTKTSDGQKCQLENVKITHCSYVTDAKVEDLLDLEDSTIDYYRLTGVVRNLRLALDGTVNPYGNFDLVDETGSIYVYGLLTGWGGPKKQFLNLGIKEGDTLTLVGYKSSYGGSPEIEGAFYVSHTPADDVFYGDTEDVEIQ